MKPIEWLALVFLLVICIVVAPFLWGDLLWYDEGFSRWISGGLTLQPLSLFQIPELVFANLAERHPPMFYMMTHVGSWFWGFSDFSMRLIPFFAGVLGISMMYRLAKDMTQHAWGGLLGAFVVGASAFYLNYVHEARLYSLVFLATAMMTWGYWHLSQTPTVKRFGWAIFLGGTLLGLTTYYFFLPVVGLMGLYHLIWGRSALRWRNILIGFVVCGVLSAPPYILFLLGDKQIILGGGLTSNANDVLRNVLAYFSNQSTRFFALIAAVGIVLMPDKQRTFILWVGVGYLAFSMASASFTTIYSVRNFLSLWVFMGLIFVFALIEIARFGRVGKVLAVLAVLVWGANATQYPTTYNNGRGVNRENFTAMMPILETCALRQDEILISFGFQQWAWLTPVYYFQDTP